MERNRAAREYGEICRQVLHMKTAVMPLPLSTRRQQYQQQPKQKRTRCRIVWSDALVSAMSKECGSEDILSLLEEELVLMESEL
eukprot:4199394-Ditylum_brightwellii.AAC.1